MVKQFKIFIGVVPDDIQAIGGFNMIVANTKNKTQKVHSLNIGDNAFVVTIDNDTVIAFEPNGEPARAFVVHKDFDDIVTDIIERGDGHKLVENNLQKDEKTLDMADQ